MEAWCPCTCHSQDCRRKAEKGSYPVLPGVPGVTGHKCLKGLASCLVKSDHCPMEAAALWQPRTCSQEPGRYLVMGLGLGHTACRCMRLNLHCTFLFLCFLFLRSPGSSQGSEVSLGVTGSLVVHDGEGYATGMSLVGREYVCLCLVDGPASKFLEMA